MNSCLPFKFIPAASASAQWFSLSRPGMGWRMSRSHRPDYHISKNCHIFWRRLQEVASRDHYQWKMGRKYIPLIAAKMLVTIDRRRIRNPSWSDGQWIPSASLEMQIWGECSQISEYLLNPKAAENDHLSTWTFPREWLYPRSYYPNSWQAGLPRLPISHGQKLNIKSWLVCTNL